MCLISNHIQYIMQTFLKNKYFIDNPQNNTLVLIDHQFFLFMTKLQWLFCGFMTDVSERKVLFFNMIKNNHVSYFSCRLKQFNNMLYLTILGGFTKDNWNFVLTFLCRNNPS